MNLRPSTLSLLTGVVSLVALPESPRAESAARPCYRDVQVLPRAAASIPAGAPGLVFIPASFVSERPISAYEVELRGPDGNVVAHTLEPDAPAYVLRPAVALVAGRYEVRYVDLCNYYLPTQKRGVAVTVNQAVALPTTVGALATDSPPAVQFDGNLQPTCQPAAVDINFALDLSPELAAYSEVVRYDVAYKGRSRRFSYGQAYAFGNSKRVQLQVEDSCNLREAVGGEVTVIAHVAGAGTDPAPLKFQLNAKCPGIGPEPKPPQDAGPPLPTCGVAPDGGVPDVKVAEDVAPPPDTKGPLPDGSSGGDVAVIPPDSRGGDDAGVPLVDGNAGAGAPLAGRGGGGCQLLPLSTRSSYFWLVVPLAWWLRNRQRRR